MSPIDSQPGKTEVLYADIDADSQAPTQIESLCVNCEQNVCTHLKQQTQIYKIYHQYIF